MRLHPEIVVGRRIGSYLQFILSVRVCQVYRSDYFYIARHGETENNRARRLTGWIDSPLTPEGLEPTKQVIAKLHGVPFNAVYSSDLGRAFITAYVVVRGLGLEQEIIRVPGLREVNYGEATNMPKDLAYQRFPGIDNVTDYTPPGGESLCTMQARVLKTLSALDAQHNDAAILIVAHSGVIAAVHAAFKGVDLGGHNISEAYEHDFVGRFTLKDGSVATFEAIGG